MKRIALAIGTMAMGFSTTALYAQAPGQHPLDQPGTQPAQEAGLAISRGAPNIQRSLNRQPAPPRASRPSSLGYSLYGGPSESLSEPPQRHGVQTPSISPLYNIPGVTDEIAAGDHAREARRDAAVEFGMYRRQFTGSTEFWMDYDRTRLAKVRYSMDEPMFRSIHPAYDWGDGGYMYNTAASVGGPRWAGTADIVTPSQAAPIVRTQITRSNDVPTPAIRPTSHPSLPTTPSSSSLVASEAGDLPIVGH